MPERLHIHSAMYVLYGFSTSIGLVHTSYMYSLINDSEPPFGSLVAQFSNIGTCGWCCATSLNDPVFADQSFVQLAPVLQTDPYHTLALSKSVKCTLFLKTGSSSAILLAVMLISHHFIETFIIVCYATGTMLPQGRKFHGFQMFFQY